MLLDVEKDDRAATLGSSQQPPTVDISLRQPTQAATVEETYMREAVVVASSRTPLAKSFRGSFNLTRPDDLLAQCLTHVSGKVPQLPKDEIEDIIVGCANPSGKQGSNVARVAAVSIAARACCTSLAAAPRALSESLL